MSQTCRCCGQRIHGPVNDREESTNPLEIDMKKLMSQWRQERARRDNGSNELFIGVTPSNQGAGWKN